MAWSIFTQGGGQATADEWGKQLLATIGAPDTPGNEQFVYDWELSEGGGGKYNPLNQGPVPNTPGLTSTGSQYGGGAADYVSWAAGLTGAADYLSMPNFSAIKADLIANNPSGARTALIDSPWAASHYGGGSSFSTQPLPGGSQSLPALDAATLDAAAGNASTSGATSNGDAVLTSANPISSVTGDIFSSFLKDVFPTGMATRLILGLLGVALLIVAAASASKEKQSAPDIILNTPQTLGGAASRVSGPKPTAKSAGPLGYRGPSQVHYHTHSGAPFGKGAEGDAKAGAEDVGEVAEA